MSSLPSTTMRRKSFARGMLLGFNDQDAPDDSARYLNNVMPVTERAIDTRAGRQRRNDTVIGTKVYDVFRWQGSDSVFRDIVAYRSGSNMVYGWADGTGAPNNTVGSLTDGGRVVGMARKFRQFLCNNNDDPRVYVFDSSVQTRTIGLGTGFTPGTPTDAGAGSIEAGTYTYKATVLYGDDGESNPGAASASVTIAANRDISIPTWTHVTEPAGLTRSGYRIWRENGDGNYRLVDQVSASTTSYTDSTTQATVAGNDLLHDNHNAPPGKLQGMLWWEYEDRAVAWGENATASSVVYPNRLFLGEVGQPEIWKTLPDTLDATNTAEFIDVPQQDPSNPIIAVAKSRSAWIYVFNRFGVRAVIPTGVTALPYRVVAVAGSEDHGIIGPKAVTITDSGELYYVSTDGLRVIRGLVDVQVTPSTDDDGSGLVARGAVASIQNACNCIFEGIPESMRVHVSLHEFRDRVHIALATDAVSGVTPTDNNDVLIYDTSKRRRPFVYSRNRRVYGWMTVNDSGNPYRLVAAGWTPNASDASTQEGNIWNEYVDGVKTDEDAGGVTHDIDWKYEDFDRPVADLDVGQADNFVLDAAADGGTITSTVVLDGGRLSASKQFTYTQAGIRAWKGRSYWQGDPANDTESDTARAARLALFTAPITDGSFKINVNAVTKTYTGIDFTGDVTFDDVVATIQAVIDAAGDPITIQYITTPGSFRIKHQTTGMANTVDTMAAGGTGTDLATTALLGTGAGDIEHVTADVPSVFTGLEWWGPAVADPTAIKHDWSDPPSGRGKPRFARYNGERCQLCRQELSGTNKVTIYGHRSDFFVLPPTAAGVN